MQVRREQGLQLGWFPAGLRPGELSCVCVVKATFALQPGAELALLPEGELVSGDVPVEDGRGGLAYASDFVPFKPRADVLLRAAAHAPAGQPVRYLQVALRVGALHKQLLVAGDRSWKGGLLGRSPGEPTPFTSMPLTWERAFGGDGEPRNPVGVGRSGGPMPNVEWPGQLLRSPKDRVEPAGFGPIGPQWEPRRSRIGSYRGDYLKTRWPWYPADLEWSHFNSAPADQQLDGHLRGDEELQFTNLHRQHAELNARLPGVRARCFLTLRPDEFREVELKLDTLFVDLVADQVVLVWRGFTPVQGVRMRELEGVLAALEPLGEVRPPAHYLQLRSAVPAEDVEAVEARAAFAARLAALEAAVADASARAAALEARIDGAGAEMEAELQAQQQALLSQGLDAKLLGEPAMPQDLASARGQLAAALAQLQAERPDLAPPAEAAADDGDEAAAVAELQADLAGPEAEPSWSRERVLAAVAAGDSLAGAQLQGLDLSGLDLNGVDLHGAALAGADLSGSKLTAANLGRALLTGATLVGCRFDDANLDRADLTEAVCRDASFRGASLAAATLEGLQLAGIDFAGCSGRAPSFAGSDLAGADFRRARLPKADFGGCSLAATRFGGAELPAARFGEAKAPRADFADADLRGMHGGDACDFAGSSFRRARLDGAILTGAVLDGADLGYAILTRALLTEASLRGAELSRADLCRAVLDDADLEGARLLQANLLYCAMERTALAGADLRWANLYGAGLWQAQTAQADLRDANLQGTLLG